MIRDVRDDAHLMRDLPRSPATSWAHCVRSVPWTAKRWR